MGAIVGSGAGWPSYPPRDAMAARASGAEATSLDQDAATALDRPKFVEGVVEIPETRRRPRFEGGPAEPAVSTAGARPRGGPAVWLLLLAIGLVGGVAGGAFGVWLALR